MPDWDGGEVPDGYSVDANSDAQYGGAAAADAALRDMVVRVVREELAGPAADRFRRDVRKMVRREVRAMLADDGVTMTMTRPSAMAPERAGGIFRRRP